MSRKENLKKLSNMIQNYRKGELDIILDEAHVEKWLNQFSSESQEIILSETIHVFNSWYFSNQKIEEILEKFIQFLCKNYEFECPKALFCKATFLNRQKDGTSQQTILDKLSEIAKKKYGVDIQNEINEGIRYYIYIDDGLYTGSRARKDLADCIGLIPQGAKLDVLYMVVASASKEYVKKRIEDIAVHKKIEFSIHSWITLWNNGGKFRYKSEKKQSEEYSYDPRHFCLWPISDCGKIEEVCDFEKNINGLKENQYLYRSYPWSDDAGVFSSVANRFQVEKEFLLKGIQIAEHTSKFIGMYPLGYNLWPSFGFGSFCAFDMNISNTCPLVLWWGNTTQKGDALDFWYPLLPRRSNPSSAHAIEVSFEEKWICTPYYPKDNTCPDCGRSYGFLEDGGNGFCINCAWKH